jgi:hypothetical protein
MCIKTNNKYKKFRNNYFESKFNQRLEDLLANLNSLIHLNFSTIIYIYINNSLYILFI